MSLTTKNLSHAFLRSQFPDPDSRGTPRGMLHAAGKYERNRRTDALIYAASVPTLGIVYLLMTFVFIPRSEEAKRQAFRSLTKELVLQCIEGIGENPPCTTRGKICLKLSPDIFIEETHFNEQYTLSIYRGEYRDVESIPGISILKLAEGICSDIQKHPGTWHFVPDEQRKALAEKVSEAKERESAAQLSAGADQPVPAGDSRHVNRLR